MGKIDDATELGCRPGDASLRRSGHAACVAGDEPAVVADLQGMVDYAQATNVHGCQIDTISVEAPRRTHFAALPDAALRANMGCTTPGALRKEPTMTRKYIDCRAYPSDMKCTVALSADSDDELLEAAVQHAMAVHKHQDSPELRQQLRSMFKSGSPAA